MRNLHEKGLHPALPHNYVNEPFVSQEEQENNNFFLIQRCVILLTFKWFNLPSIINN